MIGLISWTTHLLVLGVLLLALAGSSVIFWLLVRRWTTRRQQFAMIEWGTSAEVRLLPDAEQKLVPPLQVLAAHRPQIEIQLENEMTTLLRLSADAPPAVQGRPDIEVFFNLLVRRMETFWKPAGLRPTDSRHSILDFFSLSSFSAIGGIERFVVFAIDSTAAKEFPQSTARALCPRDVGLLLCENWLLLDFSQRPFDDLEFNRMIALASQLELKLGKQSTA
jgi:hypothetical protein